jgi:cytidine deaminase
MHDTEMSASILTRMIQEHTPQLLACRENRTHNTSQHMAVIVKRGKVIASAQNRVGNRSKGSGYSDFTIHAERAVVKKLGDISQLRGATLCVWRISSIRVMPSAPCNDCRIFLEKCMREYGLRAVQYTDTIIPL